MRLWYQSPAEDWNSALPLGNGKLGAMVFGGPVAERIQLNEDSVWSGGFRDRVNPDCKNNLPEIRRLLREGDIAQAENLATLAMAGTPEFERMYQTLGDIYLTMENQAGEVEHYTRQLDLDNALCTVSYNSGGVDYTRETYISAPHNVMVVRLGSSRKGGVSFQVRMHRGRYTDGTFQDKEQNAIYYTGGEGIRFCSMLRASAVGGTVEVVGEYLVVKNADQATLTWTAATTYRVEDPVEECRRVLDAASLPERELWQAHLQDYQTLYNRARLTLAADSALEVLPTDARLARVQNGEEDLGLVALYFAFGRYLTIASSRPGSLPSNLQGVWNGQLQPAWDSKYTININTEMNYWPVEVCNLSQCHLPFFDLLERMYPRGQEVAQKMYGARGFVAHHNTDIWGLSNPVGNHGRGTGSYAYWPLSAGWLCSHAFEHYLFTQDKDFLRETGYPIIRDAGRFFLDVLIENAEGKLIFSPSTSPENVFIYNGKRCSVAETTTMTMAIVRETLENLAACCQILDTDPDLAKEVHAALERLPQFKIGSRGELLEWNEELEEAEPEHRHTSHLYTLYPAHLISTDGTPQLANACRRTLELRGDESTGWALAWRISLWAHLHDGEHAYQVLKKQLRPIDGSLPQYSLSGGGSYPNMFGGHPPFQIDSNYGACAGIAELFLQSWDGNIDLLPAVPKALGTGTIRGLRARGGVTVDLDFRDGKLEQAVLTRTAAGQEAFTLRYAGKEKAVTLAQGQPLTVVGSEF